MEPYPFGDPRLPHHLFPPKLITPDELCKRTGTLYWKVETQINLKIRKYPFQLDALDQVGLSKRLTLLKMERNFKKADIYTLDGETTANFKDKVTSV